MHIKSALITAVFGLFAATAAQATTISVGSGWQYFSFGGEGSSWSDTFEFTLTESARLNVTDAYLSGDQFAVYLNGNLLGNTSAPGSTGDQIGGDYDAAFADSRWSSASFILGAGTYQVSGTTLLSPFGSGGAALQLAPVPEPETYAMMGLGLAAVALARRRSKKAA